jgi:hypothetical protein
MESKENKIYDGYYSNDIVESSKAGHGISSILWHIHIL